MLATTLNPATIPLPPSRVSTPLDGGISTIPRTQETSYFTTPVAESYQQGHVKVDGGHGRYILESGVRRASTTSGQYFLGQTTASSWVGNRDPKLSAGAAASIALRAQRPVEVSSPDIRNSAEQAATIAAREAKPVHIQANEPIPFASSAATLAHKAAKPVAGTVGAALQPQNPAFLRSAIYGDEVIMASNMPSVIHDAAAKSVSKGIPKATEEALEETAYIGPAIQNAAAKSASKALPMAVEETLEATEAPNKRRLKISANLEEAARKAAARRLALLDKELYESGVLRRVPLPDYEAGQRQSESPRRVYSMREGAPMRSRKDPPEDVYGYTNLLEVAKRNVSRRLAGIDLQVADKKGLSYRKDWDDQAMRIAESRIRNINGMGATSDVRPGLYDKIDVGGGRLVDVEEVERIALRNVQPVLEEITAKAEAERARVAAERAEAEERKRLENLEKKKSREIKEEKKQAKAAEKAEVSRRKSEAKREKRAFKMEGQADGLTTEQPRTNGTGEQAITREMPPSSPQESRSKLNKLLGKLKRSTTSSSAEAGKEKLTGGVALERRGGERERGREREMEIVTEERGLGADGMPEPLVDEAAARQKALISLSRDVTVVEGRPPAVATENRRNIESGGVFWDRIEYIDPQEYKRRQTEKHASVVDRLESTTALFRDELMQRRSLDEVDRVSTSSSLHPLRPTTSLPASMSAGRYYIPTLGYPKRYLLPYSKSNPEAVKLAIPTRSTVNNHGPGYRHRPEADVVVPGEETERAVPLYDHPEHPIDVTVVRTETEEEEQMKLAKERAGKDVDSGQVPINKGKNVKIEEPESEQRERGVEPGRG
ncbi:hypothetical protein EV426DRAFT_704599 [Tirmania nivea]|nr:hypothetical protein EV426DRAFT_704599 [Tirmania nivea]